MAPRRRGNTPCATLVLAPTPPGVPPPPWYANNWDMVVSRFTPDGSALLEAEPLTGRTNQIRIHAWHMGMPIVGDPLYLAGGQLGAQQTLECGAPPMCLHAWQLTFPHPLTGERLSFTSPAPAWAVGSSQPMG